MDTKEDDDLALEELTQEATAAKTPSAKEDVVAKIRWRIKHHRTWIDAREMGTQDGKPVIKYLVVTGSGGPEQHYIDAYEKLLAGLGEVYPMLGVDSAYAEIERQFGVARTLSSLQGVASAAESLAFICNDAIMYLKDPANAAFVEVGRQHLENIHGPPVNVEEHFASIARKLRVLMPKIQARLGAPLK